MEIGRHSQARDCSLGEAGPVPEQMRGVNLLGCVRGGITHGKR